MMPVLGMQPIKLLDGVLHLLLLQLPQLGALALRDGHVDGGHERPSPGAALVDVLVPIGLRVRHDCDREFWRATAGPDLCQMQPGSGCT
jgi:hypothetical protein